MSPRFWSSSSMWFMPWSVKVTRLFFSSSLKSPAGWASPSG